MYHPEDAHYYEALLCTLLAQAEPPVRLAAEDIVACGNRYRLGVRREGDSATILLTLRDQERQPGPGARRLPRR